MAEEYTGPYPCAKCGGSGGGPDPATRCSRCQGDGCDPGTIPPAGTADHSTLCPTCRGYGRVAQSDDGDHPRWIVCPTCGGRGRVPGTAVEGAK